MERQAADATATAIATATTTVTSSSSSSSGKYKYFVAERRPIEVLVIVTAPEHVEEFIALDHEIWTLGEALCNLPPAGNSDEASSLASASASTSAVAVDQSTIPFISKDVWLHDNRPGEITLVFTWESQSHWDGVDDEVGTCNCNY